MGRIIVAMPQPTDENGQVLSPEKVEQMSNEPWFAPVAIEGKGTFYVACDFDQVDRSADKNYQVFKAKQYAVSQEKPKNSKYTHLKKKDDEDNPALVDVNAEEEVEYEQDDNASQVVRVTEMSDKQIDIFINLMFPQRKGAQPVIIENGYNVPGMPEDYSKLREWFEFGGLTARTVLDACVMAYDPTGPLAQGKQAMKASFDRQRKMREMETLEIEATMAESKFRRDNPNMSLSTSQPSPDHTDVESAVVDSD